ncbi:response regulator [Wenxinia saemankumensis]|uniref:Response regulator receiver domain-containing protein n=1 Tax=Wenxinia saemankumensis TaxID=1447782 RepID=A0A1M6ADI0_9RHOB|nr:response regulator [Wenxinia saemankumensis]SHI34600.1 Response regulator receiver domain-containing protein [Wenxinia saemankumensis]
MKILLVDDDPIFISLLTVSLSELGYDDVCVSTSAAEALERLKEPDQFDVFLLDVDMDGMNGIELGQNIRALRRYRDAVIIMVTARRDQPTIHSAFRIGASGYLSKPVNLDALGSCLVDAAMIRNRNIILSEARKEADAPVGHRGLLTAEFRTIQNVITLPAMMNYLSSISQRMILDSMSLRFQIPEFRQLKAAMKAEEYHPILADAAEAISLALRAVDPMITYTGGGQFIAVMARNGARNVLEKARLANEILQKMQSDVGVEPSKRASLVYAEPFVPRSRSIDERNCLLSGASAQDIIG